MKIAFCRSLIATSVLLTGTVRADLMSFANATNITIRDGSSASLYPSSITVSGMDGTISKITVQLKNLTHSQVSDIDMLLVGPTGAKLVLFSDAGGNNLISVANITLDDAASPPLPTGFLSAGSYKPTDYGGVADTFLPPAPAITFSGDSAAPTGTATLTTKFNGTDPNGVWSLYIMDDTTNSLSGSLALGWTLTITTPAVPRPVLTNAIINATGKFQFNFNGITSTGYSVLASTNMANWNVLGSASEISVGKFQFIDSQRPTNAARFYRVHSP